MTLKYKLFSGGYAPTKGTEDSACYDLHMPCGGSIESGKMLKLNLKIGFEFLESNYYLKLYSRSSTMLNSNLFIQPSIIDWDYRGPVHLIMLNVGHKTVFWERGDRFCQIEVCKQYNPILMEVDQLTETVRGMGGIGSTGV